MEFNRNLKDKWFYFPIVLLGIGLLIKIVFSYFSIFSFPFSSIRDAHNHILYLFLLVKHGFHGLVPNYWNGFILFSNYTPGWHFFSLPLYYITNSAISATFLSIIQSLILGFIFILVISKMLNISLTKKIAFFSFFFISPVLMDYLQIGRYPELLSWIFFVPFFAIIFWYRNHKIDYRFLLFIPLYSSIILTHVFTLFVSSFLIISLFLVKNFKERVILILSVLASFILTSFWWVSGFKFIFNISSQYNASSELFSLGSLISYNTVILIAFFFIFYFYYKGCSEKKRELLFFSSLLILNILILSRLINFIPFMKSAFINPYNVFFLFILLFLFFSTDFRIYPKIIKKMFPWIIVIISIIIFIIPISHMGYFFPYHTQIKEEMLSFVPYIEGRYIFVASEQVKEQNEIPKIHQGEVMDYALIYYNLSTPLGTAHPGGYVSEELKPVYRSVYGCLSQEKCYPDQLKPLDCPTLIKIVKEQSVKSIISMDEGCELLDKCGFREKMSKDIACLYINDKL